MVDTPPPLAFIYDRRFSPTVAILDLRLEACREYAAEMQWDVAGTWVDEDDDAMSDTRRPQFRKMIDAMRDAAGTGRNVVCLIADWDRLTRNVHQSAVFRRDIASTGGYTATSTGEDDRPGSSTGHLRALRPAL